MKQIKKASAFLAPVIHLPTDDFGWVALPYNSKKLNKALDQVLCRKDITTDFASKKYMWETDPILIHYLINN